VFKKLEQAQADYPYGIAAIAGKMGEQFEGGFVLEQPNIQVFRAQAQGAERTDSGGNHLKFFSESRSAYFAVARVYITIPPKKNDEDRSSRSSQDSNSV
jgi:hypothetical protein